MQWSLACLGGALCAYLLLRRKTPVSLVAVYICTGIAAVLAYGAYWASHLLLAPYAVQVEGAWLVLHFVVSAVLVTKEVLIKSPRGRWWRMGLAGVFVLLLGFALWDGEAESFGVLVFTLLLTFIVMMIFELVQATYIRISRGKTAHV